MCRHLAYVGRPLALADIVLAPPHSLVVQSYAARELLRGSISADGFGIGWFADDLHAMLRGALDSETLFLLIVAAVRKAGGDLAEGVRAALADVARRAPGSGLNVLVTDGETVVATRLAAGIPSDSLHLVPSGRLAPEGTVVASEPLDDDPAWRPVPDGTMVVLSSVAVPTLTEVAP